MANDTTALDKIIKLKNASTDGWETARKQAEKCVNAVINNPYSDQEKSDANKYGKPLLKYPLIQSKLNVLLGNEQLNRRIAKIIPNYDIDMPVVKVLNDNWKSIVENEEVERKLVQILADGLIYPTGGWIQRKIELDDYGYLNFKYDVLDSLRSVHTDPEFRRLDMMDARYIILEDWLTIDQIKREFSPKSPDENEKNWWNDVIDRIDTLAEREDAANEYKKGDRYQLLQLEERRMVNINVVRIPTLDGYVKLTDKELKNYDEYELIKKGTDDRIYITTIVPYFEGIELQNKAFPFPTRRFSCFPCFSFDYNMPKCEQTSAIYLILDVQDRINKGMNQQVDWVTQGLGKNKYVPAYEKDAIDAMKRVGNQPNQVIPLTSMKNVPKSDPDPQIPPQILVDVGNNTRFINDILGVTPAMEGLSEKSGESGVLHEQKLIQSQVSTNPYFEVLAHTRELLAKDYVELSGYVYFEDDRPLQVQTENGLSWELVNLNYEGNIQLDLRNLSARAILDEGENTPDRLQKQFEQNIAFMNILISAGATLQDIPLELVLKHSNIRDKNEWITFMKARQAVQAELAAQQQADAQMQSIVSTAQGLEENIVQDTKQPSTG